MTEDPTRDMTRDTTRDTPRYALYFAPAVGSPWWHFGEGWLRGEIAPGLTDPDAWAAMVDEPRRYGFHATLKAPFRLAPHAAEDVLIARIGELAGSLRAAPLGELVPLSFDGYVALTPGSPRPALQSLAARCVIELDDLRAPSTAAEIARRRPERLDPRGIELLGRYGYPQVLERFRFHMTLAICTQPAHAAAVLAAAGEWVERLNRDAPPVLERLCLFVEPRRGAPLERRRDFLLQP